MFHDPGAVRGMLFSTMTMNSIRLDSGKGRRPFSRKSDDGLNTLRFTLVALILSMVWLIFNPIWFPKSELKYDFMRFFLFGVALLATVVTYMNYKRTLRSR